MLYNDLELQVAQLKVSKLINLIQTEHGIRPLALSFSSLVQRIVQGFAENANCKQRQVDNIYDTLAQVDFPYLLGWYEKDPRTFSIVKALSLDTRALPENFTGLFITLFLQKLPSETFLHVLNAELSRKPIPFLREILKTQIRSKTSPWRRLWLYFIDRYEYTIVSGIYSQRAEFLRLLET